MLQAFKTFINRGNVLDLAVAVIIGAAFSKIVSSLTDDVIMPVIGKVSGDLDFSSFFVRLGPIPASYTGSPTSYAQLKAAGVPMVGYGQFITVAVQFLIVAFVVFLIVRAANKLFEKPAPVPVPGDAADVAVLKEILAELKKKGA
jgi:large conductance mechanosensitive channel